MWQNKALAVLAASSILLAGIWAAQHLDLAGWQITWPDSSGPNPVKLTAGETSSLRQVGIPW